MTAFHPLATFLPSSNDRRGASETSIRIVECLLSLFRCQKRPVRVRLKADFLLAVSFRLHRAPIVVIGPTVAAAKRTLHSDNTGSQLRQ
ncbi:hypothetical protein ATY79_23105 [Rhizobium sp. R693]|nr:hypothetical protein ATY79_23105 [Rhizobium sp. R693]